MISNVCVIYHMKFSILQKFGFEKIQNLKFIKTTNSGGKRRMYFLDFFWNLLVLSLKEKYLKSWIIANFIIFCFQIHEYPSHPAIWLEIDNTRQLWRCKEYFPQIMNLLSKFMSLSYPYSQEVFSKIYLKLVLRTYVVYFTLEYWNQNSGWHGYSWIPKQEMINFDIFQDFKILFIPLWSV